MRLYLKKGTQGCKQFQGQEWKEVLEVLDAIHRAIFLVDDAGALCRMSREARQLGAILAMLVKRVVTRERR